MKTPIAVSVCILLLAFCGTAHSASTATAEALLRLASIEQRGLDRVARCEPDDWTKLFKRIEEIRHVLQTAEEPNAKGDSRRIRSAQGDVNGIDKRLQKLEKKCAAPARTAPSPSPSKRGDRTAPVPPPSPVPQPVPTPQMQSLWRDLDASRARIFMLGARATAEQKALLAKADKLLASPDAANRLQEIRFALRTLDAATTDPCDGSIRSLLNAREMGQNAQVWRSYKEIEALTCHDPAVNEEAQAYLLTAAPPQEDAPPPPAGPIEEAVASPLAAVTQRMPQEKMPMREQPPVQVQKIPAQSQKAPAQPAGPVPAPAVLTPRTAWLALDVWQSAWDDFATLSTLTEYARRNSIHIINLNPGHGVTEATMSKSHAQLSDLVRRLRQGGIEEINYLYAELGYPIGNYATLLTRYPDLRITTLVDDSEFTDDKKHRFEENARIVKAARLRYSAFITLESVGNSGVSDSTRYWAIDRIDEPIFMSYFGCSLEEQREILSGFLEYADRQGKVGNVKIAILLGGKKVGRERSCEQELGPAEFPRFLASLHSWAQSYRSYGGIVLETDLRLPRYDVVSRGSSLDREPSP